VSLISLSCGNIAHAGILPACLRHLGNIPATSRNQPHYWPQWQSLFAYYSLLDIILSFYILLEYPWSDKLSYLATSFSTWYIFLQLMLCCCYLTLAQFGVFSGIIRSTCVLNIWAELVFSIGVKLSLTTSTLAGHRFNNISDPLVMEIDDNRMFFVSYYALRLVEDFPVSFNYHHLISSYEMS